MGEEQDRDAQIADLLGELNELEKRYGRVQAQADPLFAPSGEVNARVDVLTAELAELGVRLRWTGDRYVIEDGDDAGS